MLRFLVRRALQALGTLLLSSLVVHAAVTVLPGDPVRAMFGWQAPPPEVLAALREQFNLNEPYLVQYQLFMQDVWAMSVGGFAPRVGEGWPVTLRLVVLALGLQLAVGLAGGLWTAIHPASRTSRLVVTGSIVMIAVPVVLSTYVLQGLFELRWHVFPYSGSNPIPGGTADSWMSYVLPTAALAAMTLGTVIIFLRSELRQTLRAPFIRFATANGIARPRVIAVHALRAATPPVVAYLASNLGQVFLGVMIVEGVFNLPGIGNLMFSAIRNQDRFMAVTLVMLVTIVVVLLNLVADVIVAALDPRARVGLDAEGS